MIVLAFLVMFLIAIIIGLVVELGKQGKALEDAEELLVEQDARLIMLTAELEDLRRGDVHPRDRGDHPVYRSRNNI